MSDDVDWEFAGPDDAKAEIRAAVGYLLKDAAGAARDRIALQIMEIVRQLANGCRPNPAILWTTGCPAANAPQQGETASSDSRKAAGESWCCRLHLPGRSAPARGSAALASG
jgi:hypothetical protein